MLESSDGRGGEKAVAVAFPGTAENKVGAEDGVALIGTVTV